MSAVGDFIGDFVGGITGTKKAVQGAQQAAGIQAQSYEKGIAEQGRQFDKIVDLMAPFIDVGSKSVEQQGILAGVYGEEAQQEAIADIESSPEFQAYLRQGEEGILQNASATGGLRGGNVQQALAQFRPELLSSLINNQYARLGGLTQVGQAAAAGQAAQGGATAANISSLLAQQGSAVAGGVQAGANRNRLAFGDILDIGNLIAKF